MNRIRHALVIVLAFGAVLPAICHSQSIDMKEMPKEGNVPLGIVVYVDDGKCPKGQVKEVTGGSQEKSIPRKVRCVKRPGGSPPK